MFRGTRLKKSVELVCFSFIHIRKEVMGFKHVLATKRLLSNLRTTILIAKKKEELNDLVTDNFRPNVL